MFSLGLPDKINPLNLKNRLDKENIYISLRGSNIRVSLNIFNDVQDIERLISVIKKELIF